MDFSDLLDCEPQEVSVSKQSCGLVVGMHRSGTSCVAGVLSLLGLAPPTKLIGASSANPKGQWESSAVTRLNDKILEFAGSQWMDWQPFNENWYDTPYLQSFVNEARDVLGAEFGDSPMMVLKDPRICRLSKFWLHVLDESKVEPLIFMPFRDPVEVAQSLNEHNGFEVFKSEFLWLRYVLDAERGTRGRPRVIFSYVNFISDWRSVIMRAEETLGVQFPKLNATTSLKIDRFIDTDLYRNRADPISAQSPQLSAWVTGVRDILCKWSELGENAEDHAELDLINADFSRCAEMFAPLAESLRHLDQENSQLSDEVSSYQAQLEAANKELQAEVHNLAHAKAMAAQSERSLRVSLAGANDKLVSAYNDIVAVGNLLRNEEIKASSLQADLANCNSMMKKHQQTHAKREALLTAQVESLNRQVSAVDVLTLEIAALKETQLRMSQMFRMAIAERIAPPSGGNGFKLARWNKYKTQLGVEGVFDEAGYIAHNPDVAASGMDPVLHYLEFGFQENRRFRSGC